MNLTPVDINEPCPNGPGLLSLPPELLQLILMSCSTPSFLQLSVICRWIYDIASSSRPVILHHLLRTPGLKSSIDTSLPNSELFRLLKSRTAEHLYGANFHSNLTSYIFRTGLIDTPASAVDPSGSYAALVEKGVGRIFLYRIERQTVHLRKILEPPCHPPGRVEVVKVIFCTDGSLAVLQKFEPAEEAEQPHAYPFMQTAIHYFANSTARLMFYSWEHMGEGTPQITLGAFYDIGAWVPVTLDASGRSKAVIVWKTETVPEKRKVTLHTPDLHNNLPSSAELTPYVLYDSVTIVDEDGQNPDVPTAVATRPPAQPIVKLNLNDFAKQVNMYHPASPLYNRYLNLPEPNTQSSSRHTVKFNSCRVNFGSHRLSFSISIPFYCTHETDCSQPNRPVCHWKYLALGVTTHPIQNWTIACLLRSEARCRSSNCEHIPNLERGRRLDIWKVVARLWGYQARSNALSGLVASSPKGKRLAIADWNTVYVWALEPGVIMEADEESCSGYYPDIMKVDGKLELRPITLRPQAVCHSLHFSSEDELIALTDKGLMRWSLGPRGTGFRVKKFLDMEENKQSGNSSVDTWILS
ncbi:hypothetical protein LOZ65_004465 [Ophidiomyces ophidiicola]|nr:hypothetical protein LOZ65_004465 [Ophidiomyces ophidiicola]